MPDNDVATPVADSLTIVDTTLREGEQFAGAHFTSEQRLALSCELDAFGVDILEVPSPRLSPQTARDVAAIAALGLRAQVVAHVRCVAEDIDAALATGVNGVNLFCGVSPYLRAHSHRRDLAWVAGEAASQVRRVRDMGRYVRFSAEDAFRTPVEDLIAVFDAAVAAGACRIGLPDTVGIASPREVEARVSFFTSRYPGVGIEFHGHNDTGCAVANAVSALDAGADAVDVTVLGIGERNGITSLSGLIAALYLRRREWVERFALHRLPHIDGYVARLMGMPIPFNSPITSASAFTHRAGVHTNAVLREPSSYEVLDPASFGLARSIDSTSRLAGRHSLRARAEELGLSLDDVAARKAGERIKQLADARVLTQEEVDNILRLMCLEGKGIHGYAG